MTTTLAIIAIVILIAIPLIPQIPLHNKVFKSAFSGFLILCIAGFGFLIYDGIKEPIDFEKIKEKRSAAVKQRLLDIREAQNAYKDVYGKHAESFEKLIEFVRQDSLKMIKKSGDFNAFYDTAIVSRHFQDMTHKDMEMYALEKGIISRDTFKVSVKDSLFGNKYPVDSLRYIPFSQGKEFQMGAGEVLTGSKVKVEVFEAKAPFNYFLGDLNKQLVINLNEEFKKRNNNQGYPGLKVGSLSEANNGASNWEIQQ